VLAVAALAAYLAGAFDSGSKRHFGVTYALDRPAGAALGASLTSSGRSRIDSPSGGPAANGSASAIIRALDNYWEDVERHAYAAAFGFYAPGALNLTEAQFISEQEHLGLKSVTFDGTVSAATAALDRPNRSYATVAVDRLLTRDAQYGCRRWSGSYTMLLEESGLWHIQHAALEPRPC